MSPASAQSEYITVEPGNESEIEQSQRNKLTTARFLLIEYSKLVRLITQ